MGSSRARPGFLLPAAILILLIVPAAGWTFQMVSISPAGQQVSPQTPVEANFSIGFESWTTGSTFDKDNTLLLSTNLTNPRWTVTRVERIDGQEPIVEAVPVRQAWQVRLDGWTLSYSRKQYSLVVRLAGTAPSPPVSQNITLVSVQEMKPGGKAVPGSLIKKELGIRVPVTAATPVPVTTVPEAPLPVPTTGGEDPKPAGTPPPGSPAIPEETAAAVPEGIAPERTTYSPGPDTATVVILLAGLAIVAGPARRTR